MLSLAVLLSGISVIASILCHTAYKMWRLLMEDRHRQRVEITAREFQVLDFQRILTPIDSQAIQEIEKSFRINGEKYQASFMYDVRKALELREKRREFHVNALATPALAPVSNQ